MKVAFTTEGSTLDSRLDSRFGRAPQFLIHNLDDDTFEVVDNQQNLNAPQGAGIQAAGNVARAGAQAIVTGHCGPKAFRVLQEAGIKVYSSNAKTVAEALAQFRAGQLVESDAADVEGHRV